MTRHGETLSLLIETRLWYPRIVRNIEISASNDFYRQTQLLMISFPFYNLVGRRFNDVHGSGRYSYHYIILYHMRCVDQVTLLCVVLGLVLGSCDVSLSRCCPAKNNRWVACRLFDISLSWRSLTTSKDGNKRCCWRGSNSRTYFVR